MNDGIFKLTQGLFNPPAWDDRQKFNRGFQPKVEVGQTENCEKILETLKQYRAKLERRL